MALALALMQDQAGLPKEEEGRGAALPEIGQGDSRTPLEFASVLHHADAAAVKPIVNALSRVAASEHDRERYGREVRCDLVLLIDQLDELFAASVSEAERTALLPTDVIRSPSCIPPFDAGLFENTATTAAPRALGCSPIWSILPTPCPWTQRLSRVQRS